MTQTLRSLFLFLTIGSISILNAQIQVVVPDQIVSSDFASNGLSGWRMVSLGNSSASLVSVSDFSIPATFGPHSVRANRIGGSGLNRSFLGYFEPGRTLSSLVNVSFNRFSEQGTDSYLNIFITNGTAVATVVYEPAVVLNAWQSYSFNSSSTGNISIRIGGNVINMTYAQLINEFGNWLIYNHPATINLANNTASDFIGGIVLVSGSSSPTQPQTHTFDGVTIGFSQAPALTYDFVSSTPQPPGCFATEVISYTPGLRKDNSSVPAERSIPDRATLSTNGSDAEVPEANVNFVSLGFGGSITLKMADPIKNGPGKDLRVYETTYNNQNCNRSPERVNGFASQDGCNWVYLGEICQNGEFDLAELNWAQYFRFVDVSTITSFPTNPTEDGYDLDAIECLNGIEENPVAQDLGAFFATSHLNFTQGLRRNNTPVLIARSNPNQALFQPQNNNTINFVSLGFSGTITLRLGYVMFNKPGNDFQIFETTFNNQTCNSYPERALVEVSIDNQTFFSLGTFCLDAVLDLGSVPYAQYIRITDRSARTRFESTADGYDIDGILVLNPGCGSTQARLDEQSSEGDLFTEETLEWTLSPNPGQGQCMLRLQSPMNETVELSLVDLSGRTLWQGNYAIEAGALHEEELNLSQVPSGLYLIRVNHSNGSEMQKWIKQ